MKHILILIETKDDSSLDKILLWIKYHKEVVKAWIMEAKKL